MLDAIRRYFTAQVDPGHTEIKTSDVHRLRVATGALLIEMMRMDSEVTERERKAVLKALGEKFSLGEQETQELVDLAEAEATEAIDYYQFTSLIKKNFSPRQKARVVEYLWQVAFSDGKANQHEEYLVRKIANLLGVPHKTFIEAKQAARNSQIE